MGTISILKVRHKEMSRLFDACSINGMSIANRFVRSATWEGLAAEDGSATPRLIETMTALAEGGVGLIISSHSYIRTEGQATPWQLGIYKDELIPGLRQMTTAVHSCGGKILMQLAHAGNFAAEALTGQPPLVVSDYEGLAKTPRKEITAHDIQEIVTAFADAARRAEISRF
jgi:2,4-dienoyl-CoA reductase-like NADH-dependent reductase (Old Yellow Enzyme family)